MVPPPKTEISLGLLPLTMLLLIFKVAPLRIPPPDWLTFLAVLPEMVTLFRFVVPVNELIAPPCSASLLKKVLLLTLTTRFAAPLAKMAPPAAPPFASVLLPLKVHRLNVVVPA